ncbi:DUF2064 domain-containing protein [Gordonia sp. CPCC 206044]|uniref:TIGR04282 family arsenosugar biosynthesis glycosyltransferase n=1 Tax=Gordonia sp. CPCC 206044 TaxID=3140793 RepID=UPI003AF36C75
MTDGRRDDEVVLVVAKAPVAGQAKTRLIPRYGAQTAAALAGAALIDTVRTARASGARVVVALRGRIADAADAQRLDDVLTECTVIRQRGNDFGERLTNAHLDVAADGARKVIQIGMDTPQISVADLRAGLRATRPGTAVLGPAYDGGWWAVGLYGGRGAESIAAVPMSREDTGEQTADSLRAVGLDVRRIRALGDVDRPEDVDVIARQCGRHSEFAALAQRCSPGRNC